MRISTAVMTTLLFSATTSVAWSLGAQQPKQETLLLPLAEAPQTTAPTETQTATARPTAAGETAAPTTSSTSQPTSTQTQAPAPTSTQAPAQPTATPTQTQAPAPAQPVVVTKTSDVINYKYGVVQISMTKTDSKITDVTLLQGDASYGRDAAYTALIQATIQVQGTAYGNVTGATFTTEAFKKAVDNVMAKF